MLEQSALGSALESVLCRCWSLHVGAISFGVSWAVIVLIQPCGDRRYQRCHGVIYVIDVQDREHDD